MAIGRTHDLYWAAGFLEGEGSFCAVKAGKYKSQTITCQQTQEEPLQRLLTLFGGSVIQLTDRPGRKRCWQWKVSGARARGVMMTLYVLMSPRRREQIEVTLAAPVRSWQRRTA